MKLVVIDYESGNLRSVTRALELHGIAPVLTDDPVQLQDADAVVLPGVGSGPSAMAALSQRGLVEPLRSFVASGKPFLGVCLGLQLLFSRSTEFTDCEGLNIINGKVENLSKYIPNEPVPHVGWNTVIKPKTKSYNNGTSLLNSQSFENDHYYFVHSYFVEPDNLKHVFTQSSYATLDFCSSVLVDNIFACQFHPEKSGTRGLRILKNFFS